MEKIAYDINLRTTYLPDTNYDILKTSYMDDYGIALLISESGSQQREATATVNLAAYGEFPAEGNVFIKDYAENEGMLAALIKAGIISEPVRIVPCGFAEAYECKVLI